MPAYLLEPPDGSNLAPVQADASGADAIEAYVKAKYGESFIRKEIPHVWLDGGGAIHRDESEVHFEANGTNFGIFVRQIPYILETLINAKKSERVPGLVRFGGFFGQYAFTLETRAALIRELTELHHEHYAEIREAEVKLRDAFQSHPNLAPMAKCSCQSGKLFTECCGVK